MRGGAVVGHGGALNLTSEELLNALLSIGILTDDEVRDDHHALAAADNFSSDAGPTADRLIRLGKLTKFQANQVLGGKVDALLVGDYVLVDRIAAGAMGQIFKAQHRRMKRVVAIKLLAPSLLKNADSVRRFQREVEAAGKLMHANIVTAFDAGQAGGSHYLAMEYVEGRDLSAIVKDRGPLPIDEAIHYIRQAAMGLGYAHSQGIVHRDIKPANLLVDALGTVKILDMGLARVDDDDAAGAERLTQAGEVMGTVDYMAPEQVFDTRSADARSDVYSLGCTLYRLLIGENMYGGQTTLEKCVAHSESPIPDMQTRRTDVTPELQAVFSRMVAKRPENRYQTMSEVVVALDNCRAACESAAATSPVNVTSNHRPGDWTSDSTTEIFGHQRLKRIAELDPPSLTGMRESRATDSQPVPQSFWAKIRARLVAAGIFSGRNSS